MAPSSFKNSVNITHISTATAIIEIDGVNLLTDPFFSPAGTEWDLGIIVLKNKDTPALALHDLPPIDAILLSHEDHPDNLDDVGRRLLDGRRVLTTVDGAKKLQPRPGVRGLKPWDTVVLEGALQLTMDVKQGVRLFRELKADVLVPMHYESWNHFKQGGQELAKAFEEEGVADKVCWLTPGFEEELSVEAKINADLIGRRDHAAGTREKVIEACPKVDWGKLNLNLRPPQDQPDRPSDTLMRASSFLFLLPALVAAQLPFPKPPFLPPNISTGAQTSSGGFPNPKWTSLLGSLIYFYDEQRSGTLPSSNRVPWRNDSLILEGRDVGIDLSGGFYDAGDFSKDTFPLSFALMSLCWGATDFGRGYDLANQTAYLDDTLRWGLDWLIKAHPNETTLVVFIASADEQNTYWGGDRSIPSPRPVYTITDTNPGTDAAAGAAAAFAACSNLYAGRGFSNSSYSPPAQLRNDSYASTLLTHGQQLYSFAVNATGGRKTYQTSVPQAGAAYASSGYGDELAMAALFLSWATGSSTLYQEAESYYTRYQLADSNRVFNWDSKTPGLAVLFSQINQGSPSFGGNFSTWRDAAEGYFDAIVNERGPGYLLPDGLLFYDGDSDDASLNPALNAAMLLARFAPLASSVDKRVAYSNFAKSQVDYVLGKNSMNVPYIVGVNPNSPKNPHSAMASGGIDIGNIDTDPVEEAYVLYGAVVGGPDKRGRFFDIRSDWPQTEVALDYNAPMLTLTAMHVLSDTTDPYYTALQAGAYDKVKPKGLPCDSAFHDGCEGSRLSKNATLAMAIVVTVVGLILVGLSAWYLILLFRTRSEGKF